MMTMSSLTRITTAALILTILLPSLCHARHLRHSRDNIVIGNTSLIEAEYSHNSEFDYSKLSHGDDYGFETVSAPFTHAPLNTTVYYDRQMRRLAMIDDEEMDEVVEDAEPKEYLKDDILKFVEPDQEGSERKLPSCGSRQLLWVFKVQTDQYGYETKWNLKRGNQIIASGPPSGYNYADTTMYQGARCLQGDQMYVLTVEDKNKDGLCCKYGMGYYTFSVDGYTQFNSRGRRTFTNKKSHSFYVGLPTPANNGNLSNNGAPGAFQGRTNGCSGNQQKIGVELMTDRFGGDNSWTIKNSNGQALLSGNGYTNGVMRSDSKNICVSPGTYKFTLNDTGGDGICCQEGKGYYKVYMNGQVMVQDNYFNFGKQVSFDIIAGYHTRLNNLSDREQEYLNGHNWRRKKYHEKWGSTYVPLKWDLSLARAAQSWANKLLDNCDIDGIKHEPGVDQGENLAKNMGQGSWGEMYSVENINRRWFEREEGWPSPDNAHLTQGTWRSSHYLGCAEGKKTMSNGGMCHTQVCRYARAGNCMMGQYSNWKTPTLMLENACGPKCAPNGCH